MENDELQTFSQVNHLIECKQIVFLSTKAKSKRCVTTKHRKLY